MVMIAAVAPDSALLIFLVDNVTAPRICCPLRNTTQFPNIGEAVAFLRSAAASAKTVSVYWLANAIIVEQRKGYAKDNRHGH